MRISDWSSDVCSSDLLDFRGNNIADLYPLTGVPLPPSPPYQIAGDLDYDRASGAIRFRHVDGRYGPSDIAGDVRERKSVELGKSVSVSVGLGGRRIIKTKKTKNKKLTQKS